jgi:hypothetical protein
MSNFAQIKKEKIAEFIHELESKYNTNGKLKSDLVVKLKSVLFDLKYTGKTSG